MSRDAPRASEIFKEFCSLSGAARQAYLDKACGDDPALRAEVEGLLAEADTIDLLEQHVGAIEHLDTREPRPDLRVEGYQVLREISRGGQAVVFEARQESTGRRVAIKVLHEGPYASDNVKARFEREVAALANLQHPNLVQVIDRGVTKVGHFFLVMDYIDGRPLSDIFKLGNKSAEADVDPSARLKIFVKIIEAVNEAHVHGIVHRDLKPSNILLDPRDEPHVLDFGLARKAMTGNPKSNEAVTLTGQFLGSLPWASPEQANGRGDQIDIRSDVYSLGVILYQLVTGGKFPYKVIGSMREVLDNILQASPTPPSQILQPNTKLKKRRGRYRGIRPINASLESVVLKALAKQPQERYQSAGDLAADLKKYLAGEPTYAELSHTPHKIKRSNKRVVITALSAVLAIGVVFLLLQFGPGMIRPKPDEASDPKTDDTQEGPDKEKLSPLVDKQGYTILFDGKSTDRFRGYMRSDFPSGSWKIEDGTLHCMPGSGDIITKNQYSEFDLRWEWKVARGADSGVLYRVKETSRPTYATGMEYQLVDDNKFSPNVSTKYKAASLYRLIGRARENALKPAGQWNTSRIVVSGNVVEHWLNGEKVIEYSSDDEESQSLLSRTANSERASFSKDKVGHIAFQNNQTEVWFRNIRIKSLAADPPYGKGGRKPLTQADHDYQLVEVRNVDVSIDQSRSGFVSARGRVFAFDWKGKGIVIEPGGKQARALKELGVQTVYAEFIEDPERKRGMLWERDTRLLLAWDLENFRKLDLGPSLPNNVTTATWGLEPGSFFLGTQDGFVEHRQIDQPDRIERIKISDYPIDAVCVVRNGAVMTIDRKNELVLTRIEGVGKGKQEVIDKGVWNTTSSPRNLIASASGRYIVLLEKMARITLWEVTVQGVKQLWDTQGKHSRLLDADKIAFSQDESRIAIGGYAHDVKSGWLSVVDLKSGKTLAEHPNKAYVHDIDFAGSSQDVVTFSESQKIRYWKLLKSTP